MRDVTRESAVWAMQWANAPMTEENFLRLARNYERSYRRWRASNNPPARRHLLCSIQTARVFYSLARRAKYAGGR